MNIKDWTRRGSAAAYSAVKAAEAPFLQRYVKEPYRNVMTGTSVVEAPAGDDNEIYDRRTRSTDDSRPTKLKLLLASSKERTTPTLRETIENHDNNFTLIRTILAASVIYFHSFSLSPGLHDHLTALLLPVTSVGGLAVQMFFFLSGLFVAQSFHKDPHVPAFMMKRFLRIWPGLFVCLLATATIIAAINIRPTFSQYLRFEGFYDYVLRNSVFDLTWNIDGLLKNNAHQSLNGSIHTLPMEAKMYVVLALIGLLTMCKTHMRLAIAGAVLFVLAVIPGVVERLPFNLFNADYSRVAAAMFLAGVCVYGLSPWLRIKLWHGIAVIAGSIATTGIPHIFLFYASAVWTMIMVGKSSLIGKVWRPKQDWSYGIYIYGWPSQQIVMAVAPIHLTAYGLTLVATLLSTAFAAVSWMFVEKPSIRFGKYFSERTNAMTLWNHGRLILALTIMAAVLVVARASTFRWPSAPIRPMQAAIEDYGPHESHVGQPINMQSNGDSAIWIRTANGPAPEGSITVMDGIQLPSQVAKDVVTAKVYPSILATPGKKSIFLERRYADRIERSNVVQFDVK